MKPQRIRDLLLGLGYFGMVLAIGAGTWFAYEQVYLPRDEVTLTTGSIGNALKEGSDVKLNGVPVGKVDRIEPREGGAALTLELEPEVFEVLTKETTARLLPKTLFGERYVMLVVPPGGGDPLQPGGTIAQDDSNEAVKVEEVLDELLPVLQAIQPEKLASTLGELSLLLRGNGDNIGQTLADWGRYLKKFNKLTPEMADRLESFGAVAQTYAEATPALTSALADMATTAETVADQQSQLSKIYANVTVAADDMRSWSADNEDTIKVLSSQGRRALAAIAPYAGQFPCVFNALRDFIPKMDRALGKGTGEPGLHVQLEVVPAGGPRARTSDWSATTRPRCPYQQGRVQRLTAERAAHLDDSPESLPPPSSDSFREVVQSGAGLGEANSPAENRLIAELMASSSGVSVEEYPQWGSLLIGPTLRGTEVEVR